MKLQFLLALPLFPAASDFASLPASPPDLPSPVACLPRTGGTYLILASVWQLFQTRVTLHVFVPFTPISSLRLKGDLLGKVEPKRTG